TLIPGDGVGAELAGSVEEIFKAAFVPVEFEPFDLSSYNPATDSNKLKQAMDSIKRNKIALKGILHTPVSRLGHISLNVGMRKDLDIYASLALIRNVDGANWATRQQNVDIAMIRENTEGEYSGLEHTPVAGVVESLKVVTREKTERIARFAFDFALKNNRKKVTCIHKANIMKLGDGLFLKTCREVAKDYESSGIKFEDMIVDNASMQLVSRPSQFDVIVCGNLYGNILSNIGAALIGGPGIVPGANIGSKYAVFEPGCRHVGKGLQGSNTANPTALLLSSIHMLRSLDLNEHADLISASVHKVLAEGKILTTPHIMPGEIAKFTNEGAPRAQSGSAIGAINALSSTAISTGQPLAVTIGTVGSVLAPLFGVELNKINSTPGVWTRTIDAPRGEFISDFHAWKLSSIRGEGCKTIVEIINGGRSVRVVHVNPEPAGGYNYYRDEEYTVFSDTRICYDDRVLGSWDGSMNDPVFFGSA
ncbi:isocitrate dehydrogenase (NAD(+)) idh1, partial [Physocladia obscura]